MIHHTRKLYYRLTISTSSHSLMSRSISLSLTQSLSPFIFSFATRWIRRACGIAGRTVCGASKSRSRSPKGTAFGRLACGDTVQ